MSRSRFAAWGSAISLGIVCLLFLPQTPSPEPDSLQPGPTYPQGDTLRRLAHGQSFRLVAEVHDVSTPAELRKRREELFSQFPELTDPDPLVFTGLLPVQFTDVDFAFDPQRLRLEYRSRSDSNRDLNRFFYLWDGKRSLIHEQYFGTGQDGYRLSPTPERIVGVLSSMYITYFKQQPTGFWWNNSPADKEAFEKSFGKPTDFLLVGREWFHGIDCLVYLSMIGNQSDRYYVGINDGRWYGAKEGIIAFPQALSMKYQQAVADFLGRKIEANASDATWAKIRATLDALTPKKQAAWCRLLYSRVAKDYTPVFEYWFSNYRALGKSGVVFPYREDFLFYNHEGQEKMYISSRRTVRVKKIILDQPLGEKLFHEPLNEGATIVDEIHQPRLIYKHKKKFNPQEWADIVQRANDSHDEEALHRMKVHNLIGKPAPALPTGEWLNSKPLTWADLRGKIVILKFWSIGCVPCYGELGVLRSKADPKTKVPIVYIGVHAQGTPIDDIAAVAKKYNLEAPICVDRKTGEFFGRCAVQAMPSSMAVDEQGRVIAHGTLSDVLTAANRRREKVLEEK